MNGDIIFICLLFVGAYIAIGFLIYKYIIAIRLGESFKKGTVFCFFLAFFPSILYPVLGCSKLSEYTKIPLKNSKK